MADPVACTLTYRHACSSVVGSQHCKCEDSGIICRQTALAARAPRTTCCIRYCRSQPATHGQPSPHVHHTPCLLLAAHAHTTPKCIEGASQEK